MTQATPMPRREARTFPRQESALPTGAVPALRRQREQEAPHKAATTPGTEA